MDFVKTAVYIAATAVMLAAIILMPEAAPVASGFYVMILSSYLGLDVWAMIQKTSAMPKGEYRNVKVSRYLVTMGSYILLMGCGVAMTRLKGTDYGTMNATFLSAEFVVVTILLGGLEGNKIATQMKEDQNEKV